MSLQVIAQCDCCPNEVKLEERELPDDWLEIPQGDLCSSCRDKFYQFLEGHDVQEDRPRDAPDHTEGDDVDQEEEEETGDVFECPDCTQEFDSNQALAVHRANSNSCGDQADDQDDIDEEQDERDWSNPDLESSHTVIFQADKYEAFQCAFCGLETEDPDEAEQHENEEGHGTWNIWTEGEE